MADRKLALKQIYARLVENRIMLDEARELYKETFHREFDAKSIGEEIEQLFRKRVCADDKDEVSIPADLILGLILREGFSRNRGQFPKGSYAKWNEYKAIAEAKQLKKQYQAEGMRADEAKEKVAAETAKKYRGVPSKKTILEKIDRKLGPVPRLRMYGRG